MTLIKRKNTQKADLKVNLKQQLTNCKNCSETRAYYCALLQYTIQHRTVRAKFHYSRRFEAGSELVRSWFEQKFGLSSSLLAAN